MLRSTPLLVAILLLGALLPAAATAQANHPLDPLNATEITRTVEILRASGRLGSEARFATIDLAEPSKQQAHEQLASGHALRSARALIYDWETGTTIDAVVDLGAGSIAGWQDYADTDPPVRRLVIARLNEAARRSESFARVMREAGVNDLSRVSLSYVPTEDEPLPIEDGDRVVTGYVYMLDAQVGDETPSVTARVDLTRGQVQEIRSSGGHWAPQRTPPDWGREPLSRLDIEQPDGTSFTIAGTLIRWQNWSFHFGVHPRRGLELYDVRYDDKGEQRSILYRAGVSETLTPYGDPEWSVWYPLDEGDYGFGVHGARSAIPGADAPANAVYRDAVLHDHLGRPYTVPRAVAVYERYGGVLWRHAEESRPSRELVVAFTSAIDNYDYIFSWIFRQDGTLEVQVQLSGIINMGRTELERDAEPFSDDRRTYRTIVAPGVTGPIHQHFFSYRLDFDVDGEVNTVVEAQTDSEPVSNSNPDGNWFAARERVLGSELAAQREVNAPLSRTWRVVNVRRINSLGRPTAYALVPHGNVVPAAAEAAPSRRKMGFVNHHLWVTPYSPDEMHAGGDLLPPGVRGTGLPQWTAGDRNLRNTDVVLWYTLGITHQVRPEDYPVMPVHTAGFAIVPWGFFVENPALDIGR
ncbi:MAG: hypothetical protein PVJ49_11180 [Acidobacteriota bacterium]|jgi:primary-amine oxidase